MDKSQKNRVLVWVSSKKETTIKFRKSLRSVAGAADKLPNTSIVFKINETAW